MQLKVLLYSYSTTKLLCRQSGALNNFFKVIFMPDFMPDMLCVSKYEIPALLSKIEAELYKELETNLFPYNESANDKIVSFEYKGIDTHDSFYSIRDLVCHV